MTAKQHPVIPETRRALEFLREMFPAQPWHLVAISDTGVVTAATFLPTDELAARNWIDDRQGKENIYFHVNNLRPDAANIKAKKKDIVSAGFLHVDIDNINAVAELKAYDPQPTFVVFSGGGYQAFWRLKKPTTDLEAVERCNMWIARKVGGDKCHNVDRVMRLPGTINNPNAKKKKAGRVAVLASLIGLGDPTLDYDLGVFPQVGLGGAEIEFALKDGQVASIGLEELPMALPDGLRSLIIDGDDRDHPIGKPGSRYPSRSEAVYRVACSLVRLNIVDTLIAGILLNSEYGISASVREKKSPAAYVARQILSAKEAVGNEWPDVFKSGAVKPSFRNTILAIRRMGVHAEYDEFHKRKRLGGHEIQALAQELTDDGCALLRNEILKKFWFDPGKNNTHEAANLLCLENTFHPVREYLDSLKWDGKSRLATWLQTYFGADDTELTQVIGKIMLIAAVRRIRQPGVKFDTIVVLEGKQGLGKSTALRILAGDDNFSDQDLLTLNTKEQVEVMDGTWIFELCELEGLSRADTSKVKAFASRSVDRARRSYGRFREDSLRQNIFVGTTNDDQYLRDMTGNRRFWPIKTSTIDLEALARDRAQLWAEAAYWEEKDESIELPRELWATAAKEQEARLEEDPWIEALRNIHAETHGDFERIPTHLLLNRDLQIPPERMQQYHSKRLAHVMRKHGWDGPQNLKFRGGKTLRGYQRKVRSPSDD